MFYCGFLGWGELNSGLLDLGWTFLTFWWGLMRFEEVYWGCCLLGGFSRGFDGVLLGWGGFGLELWSLWRSG